jgi:hypothetical protein
MEDLYLLGGILGGMAVSGLIGFLIGDRSGNGLAGLLLAVVLGPLGWLIAALVLKEKPTEKRCRPVMPRREVIDEVEAWERKHSGTPLPPVPEHLRGKKIED